MTSFWAAVIEESGRGSSETVTLVVAVCAMIGTALGGWAQYRGKREDTTMETSKWISDGVRKDTQQYIDNLQSDNEDVRENQRLMRAEMAEMHAEILQLRPIAARSAGVDLGQLEPMLLLHELGWHEFANRGYANLFGIHFVPYGDDTDGQFDLGVLGVPIEHVPINKRAPAALTAKRRKAMSDLANKIRAEHDLPPYGDLNPDVPDWVSGHGAPTT